MFSAGLINPGVCSGISLLFSPEHPGKYLHNFSFSLSLNEFPSQALPYSLLVRSSFGFAISQFSHFGYSFGFLVAVHVEQAGFQYSGSP